MNTMNPPAPRLELLCRANITVAQPQVLGRTPLGERRVVQILTGRFEGRLNAELLPGGADWQFVTEGGTSYLNARYIVKTPEGVFILVRNRGIRHGSPEVIAQVMQGETVDPSAYYFRSTPTFETGDERYAWLNKIVALCAGARTADGLLLDFYEVL